VRGDYRRTNLVKLVTRLNQEIVRLLQRRETKEKFSAATIGPVLSIPEAAAALISDETARIGMVIKAANIRAD
jgi:tripartite-type tricarboxylate transporter receptor subunit TctC